MDIQSTKFVNLKFENSIAAPKFTNFNQFRFNQIHTNPFVTTAAINRRRLIRPITNVPMKKFTELIRRNLYNPHQNFVCVIISQFAKMITKMYQVSLTFEI